MKPNNILTLVQLSNSSPPFYHVTTYNYNENWLQRKCFLRVFWEISKLGEVSEVAYILRNRENLNKFGILQLCQKLYHVHLHISKSSSPSRNSKVFLPTLVTDLESAGRNATKNDFPIKFRKGVLKILQNSLEKLCDWVPF